MVGLLFVGTLTTLHLAHQTAHKANLRHCKDTQKTELHSPFIHHRPSKNLARKETHSTEGNFPLCQMRQSSHPVDKERIITPN